MFLSCHVRDLEWIHTLKLQCQGTPLLKQDTQPFGQMVECSIRNYVVLGLSPVAVTYKSQVFDVVLNSLLLYILWLTLSDPEVVFRRCSLFFRIKTIDMAHLLSLKPAFFVKHLLMAASTDHGFSLCCYCFTSPFLLLLRN